MFGRKEIKCLAFIHIWGNIFVSIRFNVALLQIVQTHRERQSKSLFRFNVIDTGSSKYVLWSAVVKRALGEDEGRHLHSKARE